MTPASPKRAFLHSIVTYRHDCKLRTDPSAPGVQKRTAASASWLGSVDIPSASFSFIQVRVLKRRKLRSRGRRPRQHQRRRFQRTTTTVILSRLFHFCSPLSTPHTGGTTRFVATTGAATDMLGLIYPAIGSCGKQAVMISVYCSAFSPSGGRLFALGYILLRPPRRQHKNIFHENGSAFTTPVRRDRNPSHLRLSARA